MRKKLFLLTIIIMIAVTAVNTAFAKTSAVKPHKETATTASKAPTTRKIIDGAGRTLQIPVNIKKAYATSQIGIITLYSLCPDKLAGWGFALSDSDKKYILKKYHNLPVLGVWSGKNGTGNIEQIIKVHPDVIFSIGTLEKSQVELCNKIQKQAKIPVVMIDQPLDKTDKAYEMLGSIMNEKSKAKELADYCTKTISSVKSKAASIPQDKRVRVYYAEGLKGLETDPKGSFHTEVLDLVGGINVAEVPVKGGFGRTQVSIEQLLSWDPDVIITNFDKDANGGLNSSKIEDENWQSLKAVKHGRVYQVPNRPFDWFDRPPSSNRIIGVKWLANLLYPDIFKFDMVKEVKEFYSKFYHFSLNDKDAKAMLDTTVK